MSRTKTVAATGLVVVAVLAVSAVYCVRHQLASPTRQQNPTESVAQRLSRATPGLGTGVPSGETELAAMESGEAKNTIEIEIQRVRRLLDAASPDTEQREALTRRLAMLQKLKDKMRK